ncbi:16S rRNA (guanine(966)-N(2))-methyltransferase RsmD [Bowdeniella massiliensis]|uniref:16S rRNA (guanine(966)-N(2))-methyltransferase RsmD n=1 Tax=Bowdeniella massiliensis TaxID=2932264 RepID=UPI002027FCED|nr:16S rRNA (guanine(966)-N(2))-methyltransferase RsmD [Bowdeniella massiliensis]
MTRIIAGDFAGQRLAVPSSGTRPTSDRVREALFSSVETTGLLDGARVLDLCAGSGALGIEALSRGAQFADLVESHHKSAAIIKKNIAGLKLASTRIAVHARDARTFVADEATTVAYDLVFIDPPYDIAPELIDQCLVTLKDRQLLVSDGLVIAESATRSELDPPAGWQVWREKAYGETRLTYLELAQ